MVDKYKVITLCGSTRFKDTFMETKKASDVGRKHRHQRWALRPLW